MKILMWISLSFMLFSSCRDFDIVDLAVAFVPESDGCDKEENPAFNSVLEWYVPFNSDTSLYSKRHKLYSYSEDGFLSIPFNYDLSEEDRIQAYNTIDGIKNNAFDQVNETLNGYSIINDAGFLRNEIKDEIQFRNNEEVVSLNLNTQEIRQLAKIKDYRERTLDWSEGKYLYSRNISLPNEVQLYLGQLGIADDIEIGRFQNDSLNNQTFGIRQAFQVNSELFVVTLDHGYSNGVGSTEIVIIDNQIPTTLSPM